ncbi:MAG: DUF1826 domain-containing protein [Bacteroidota bacterium]
MIKTGQIYTNAAIGYDGEVLQDIHLPSKNIAIYKRSINSLKTELADVEARTVECRVSGTVEEILSLLQDYFNHHHLECFSLLNDISELLELFERTTKSSSFRLLLATVSTNMCRKFHTDINDLRLLCTYIGPGTLWLPNEAVNHKALEVGGTDPKIVLDQQQVQQVHTGDVVILKGTLYPEVNPILHRSPSIEKTGERRLLLRIDTNEFLNFLT